MNSGSGMGPTFVWPQWLTLSHASSEFVSKWIEWSGEMTARTISTVGPGPPRQVQQEVEGPVDLVCVWRWGSGSVKKAVSGTSLKQKPDYMGLRNKQVGKKSGSPLRRPGQEVWLAGKGDREGSGSKGMERLEGPRRCV